MGHGHHEPFEVPHYSIYNNWRSIPELEQHRSRLAQMGLRDPWIRSMAAYYTHNYQPSPFKTFLRNITVGFKYGLVLAVAYTFVQSTWIQPYLDKKHPYHH